MKPTEMAITVAAIGLLRPGGFYASEIVPALGRLGFDATAQQVAAWMRPMCTVDAPWLERERSPWGDWRYRVTRFGITDVENRMPGLRVIR